MNITKSQLTRIIREEVERGLNVNATMRAKKVTPNEQILLTALKDSGNEIEILHLKGILNTLCNRDLLTTFNEAIKETREWYWGDEAMSLRAEIESGYLPWNPDAGVWPKP